MLALDVGMGRVELRVRDNYHRHYETNLNYNPYLPGYRSGFED